MALLAAQPLLAPYVDARWLVVLRGAVAAILIASFWRSYVELRDAERVPAREYALAIAVGLAIFPVWINFDSGWAAFDSGAGFAPLRDDGSVDPVLALLKLASLVVVVPLMEELFWRSFLMRWIDKRDFLGADARRASFLAFALSSALFAMEHAMWFASLVAGAAYAGLYKRAGNLRLPIISHATTNGTLGIWILATGSWRYW